MFQFHFIEDNGERMYSCFSVNVLGSVCICLVFIINTCYCAK